MNFNHRSRQGEPGIVACMGNRGHAPRTARRGAPSPGAGPGHRPSRGQPQPRAGAAQMSGGALSLPHRAARRRAPSSERPGSPASCRGAPPPLGWPVPDCGGGRGPHSTSPWRRDRAGRAVRGSTLTPGPAGARGPASTRPAWQRAAALGCEARRRERDRASSPLPQ